MIDPASLSFWVYSEVPNFTMKPCWGSNSVYAGVVNYVERDIPLSDTSGTPGSLSQRLFRNKVRSLLILDFSRVTWFRVPE